MTDVVTTDGDRTITYDYDANGQFTGAEIDTSGVNGSIQTELYNSTWQLTSATQYIVTDNGEQKETIAASYGPNWTPTGAVDINFIPDAAPNDFVFERYDHATGQMESAEIENTYQNGQYTTSITNGYDGSWNYEGRQVQVIDKVSDAASLFTYHQEYSSGDVPYYEAFWEIAGVSQQPADIWTTGTHQITLTETPNPGSATPLDRVVDETLDASGVMTGAKIYTYGIQGQPFTQTEEDYDSNWHLTTWTGSNPTTGFDQTINYTVGSTA